MNRKKSNKNKNAESQENSKTNSSQKNAAITENNNKITTYQALTPIKQNVKKDLHNIIILMFIYMLQTIPLGLTGSLPYLLSSSAKKLSYADQGMFSFIFWPFSLKVLWAPIVDSVFVKKWGRRKSWVVPLQYLIGFYLIFLCDYIKELIYGVEDDNNNIRILTGIFFAFTFVAATHDIAVDGWALTMLSKENVSWCSTCESTGGTAGWFIGNVLFLVIESTEFSNKYIRSNLGLENQDYGIVTIDKFMYFFGVVYIMMATCVMLFKKETIGENNENDSENNQNLENDLSVVDSYKIAFKIISLKPIHKIIFVMFTLRLGFATESMSFMKLIEAGVPKEKLSLLAVPLSPLQLLLPFTLSRLLNGNSPFKYFKLTVFFRLSIIILSAGWIYYTPSFKQENNEFSNIYYFITLILSAFHSASMYASYIPVMFFFSQISDKNFGGTYLTLLNTIQNLSRNWVSTGSLYLANFITFKHCELKSDEIKLEHSNKSTLSAILMQVKENFCASDIESKACIDLGGKCEVHFDPYYIQTFICFLFGMFWVCFIGKIFEKLEKLPKSEWKVYQDKIKLRTD